jgi:segregation and condensation protein B
MEQQKLKNIIEAVLMSAEKPLKVNDIEVLFAGDNDMPARDEIRRALKELGEEYDSRGFELKEVASGFRIQVRQDYSQWIGRLWEEKPARYTRALLETMALIAYRQPITRGEIEEVRGVSVSSNIIKTLLEREWIKVLGHKDVPGKPALYGTTKEFLDYFNLKSLEDLPSLAEIKDLDKIYRELDLDIDNTDTARENLDDESTGTDTEAGSEEVDEATEEVDEAADVKTVPATADNDASFEEQSDAESADAETGSEEEDENSDLNTVAAEADDVESVSDAQHCGTSDTETGSEEADEDPAVNSVAAEADDDESVEEDDFAESEPRAQSVAG